MGRKLTEQQVLDMLGIDDFRHMSKENVIKVASMIPRMEKEVAIKLIEQSPKLMETINSIYSDYKTQVSDLFFSEKELSEKYMTILENEIEMIGAALNNPDISSDDKLELIKTLSKLSDDLKEENKDHKTFTLNALKMVSQAAAFAIGAVALTFGAVRLSVHKPDEIEEKKY